MYFFKNFFSHLLAIVIFIIVLFLTGTNIAKELITRNNIINAINETNYMEEVIKESSSEYEEIDEIWQYIEIEDIINNYAADKILFELKIIKEEPKIDLEELNDRIALGIEAYIDDKIDDYTGGVNSLLESAGIDLGLSDKVNDYISNNTSIDLTNNKIITQEDLDSIYKEFDEAFVELRESTYVYEILEIVYNDTLQVILIIAVILIFIIIALINFNAVTSIAYMIAPFTINAVLFLIGYIATKAINVSGGMEAGAINYLIKEAGIISFKYAVILGLIAIIMIFLYYIGKRLSITISHKTGKTTLDTFFDDYNSEEVVKEILNKEKENLEEKE